jgi:hypothetical protein
MAGFRQLKASWPVERQSVNQSRSVTDTKVLENIVHVLLYAPSRKPSASAGDQYWWQYAEAPWHSFTELSKLVTNATVYSRSAQIGADALRVSTLQ